MSDDTKAKANSTGNSGYEKPKGASSKGNVQIDGQTIAYSSSADWIILRKKEKPRAEMFYISYTKEGDTSERPITFVFNGGPGASSVYLHLGAIGPKCAVFGEHGEPAQMPAKLIDNAQSWLAFTDLVFVDPVGTGFSRLIEDGADKKTDSSAGGKDNDEGEYWKVKRDLESLSEFISKYLSVHHRWESPVVIAGESYGGFRTAKLTRMLQQGYGVGLNAAVIISPAMEFMLLNGSDYDALHWVDTFPTMAGAAYVHGKARKQRDGESLRDYMNKAGQFAVKELLPVLAAGDMYGSEAKNRVLNQAADYIGLDRSVVRTKNGRVEIDYFVKNLLREKGKHLGLYDASLAVTDPYPERDSYSGPDPTLHIIERIFASGINTQLRSSIGLETDRDYSLLSMQVNRDWQIDTRDHALDTQVGATDDLRYGMTLNPDMKVYITHGIFDLVTPYFSADRITNLMKLSKESKANLTVKHYEGGHMFYTWSESRKQFFEDMKDFYRKAGAIS